MMLERLNWSVLALAQCAEIQIGLFPDFAPAGEELALCWEEALGELESGGADISSDQKDKIEALDKLILAMSGPDFLRFGSDGGLNLPEWGPVRLAAAEVARSFGWPMVPPPPSQDIYLKG
ncbi:hypothetical protein [Azospirillum sp. B4]|uniref:hypothetical protein n=1 Tax=Azospirillum sp. B4 TaxID=95605 RepID=UPI0005CA621D|nr:hypothetical protein [Azospirillum sp. B4]